MMIMAREFNKRPSEIMGINNDYVAYCFDEVALFYMSKAIGDDGRINWKKINWKGDKKNNKDLVEFIKKHG